MPINFKCPNCGQATELPDAAINRRARCTSCHSVYAVRDVVQGSSQPIPPQPVLAPDGSMSGREKLVVGLSISIFAILSLAFITYWFGYRDTWETDNFSNIIARCEAVLDASNSSDDDAATQAYNELTTFIGNRSIKTQSLATRIEMADQAIAPILARLEQEKRKREAKAQAAQQRRENRKYAAASQLPKERYYRDSHGAIMSETEAENRLWIIRNQIDTMPDNLEKAYLGGVLLSLEQEWARIKRQGPIKQ